MTIITKCTRIITIPNRLRLRERPKQKGGWFWMIVAIVLHVVALGALAIYLLYSNKMGPFAESAPTQPEPKKIEHKTKPKK